MKELQFEDKILLNSIWTDQSISSKNFLRKWFDLSIKPLFFLDIIMDARFNHVFQNVVTL